MKKVILFLLCVFAVLNVNAQKVEIYGKEGNLLKSYNATDISKVTVTEGSASTGSEESTTTTIDSYITVSFKRSGNRYITISGDIPEGLKKLPNFTYGSNTSYGTKYLRWNEALSVDYDEIIPTILNYVAKEGYSIVSSMVLAQNDTQLAYWPNIIYLFSKKVTVTESSAKSSNAKTDQQESNK